MTINEEVSTSKLSNDCVGVASSTGWGSFRALEFVLLLQKERKNKNRITMILEGLIKWHTTSKAFCCADIPCSFSPELLLSKVNAVDVIFYRLVLFVQPGLQLRSNMSMSLYSPASIAENLMLSAFVHAVVQSELLQLGCGRAYSVAQSGI